MYNKDQLNDTMEDWEIGHKKSLELAEYAREQMKKFEVKEWEPVTKEERCARNAMKKKPWTSAL